MSVAPESIRVALPTQCALGEGLHWDDRRSLLWFVDVYGPHVFWFNPDTQESGKRALSEPVGWVLSLHGSDNVLVGLKSGIALLNVLNYSAQIEWVDRRFPANVDHRLNDAKADKEGRLWYGSVSAVDESQPVGRLASYAFGDAAPVVIDDGYKVTNGPAFDRDCSVMLHNDSGRRITYRFDINPETGAATHRAVWRQFDEDEGCPDGMCFDSDGCVWIAHWGAGCVCRYDLHANRLLTIQMPATNVTNVCFAGRDMSRMFVTSASRGLNDAQVNAEHSAGALFEVFGVNVHGLPSWRPRI